MIMMASRSRAAQEKLQVLEKESAPFEEQLVEAATFIGTTLDALRRSSGDGSEGKKEGGSVVYHGREEWLFRWLLKRLQAPKEDIPRRTSSSWWLFCYLIRNIPLVNVAQILVDRKFVSIIQLGLEELDKKGAFPVPAADSESSSTEQGSPEKKSKKRKRSGEIVTKPSIEQNDLPDLLEAIFAAVNSVVGYSKVTARNVEQGRSSAFVAEYMKTVIKSSAEDAAKTLGLWLGLCSKALSANAVTSHNIQDWLSPFIELWKSHTAGENQYLQFSLLATKSLLSLIRTLKSGEYTNLKWTFQLEALVARNIIVPAKVSYVEHKNTEILTSLTRISILQESANAEILFEIAIRCIQLPGARRRRRPQDDAWLAAVFNTLKAAIPNKASSATSISAMLKSAIDYKVSIDLEVLREIVWEYGLPKDSENWNLVATVLKLDGNTFLIPDEKELLKELFERVTNSCTKPCWQEIAGFVASDVAVPLMNEFAKARDLSGFIKLWYAQIVAFRKLAISDLSATSCAWEAEELQTEIGKLFEPSLTIQQISQLLDWLELQVKESLEDKNAVGNVDPVCLILDAIAGSVSGEESVVDAIGLRLYHILFNNKASESLSFGYRWRSWRMLSRTLTWLESSDLDDLSMLWEKGDAPFDLLLEKDARLDTRVMIPTYDLETLEILSLACAALEATEAEKSSRLKKLVESVLLRLLSHIVDSFREIVSDMSPGNLGRLDDDGKMKWSYARCIFVEYPRCLELGFRLEGDVFKGFLQDFVWLSSISRTSQDGPKMLATSFAGLWPSILKRDSLIFNNRKLIKMIVDTLLNSTTNANNPLINTDTSNEFAIQCLHMLKLEDITKSQKEAIMKSWPTPESTVLDLPVLALKVKIMQHPAIYEGMRFKDLIKLAETLEEADIAGLQNHLALLKELTRRIFAAALANMDQKRNTAYITEAFKVVQKKVKKASKKKDLGYAFIGVIDVALVAFHEKEMALNDHNIILRDDLEAVTATFKEALLVLLLHHFTFNTDDLRMQILPISIVDALDALGVDGPGIDASTLERVFDSIRTSINIPTLEAGKLHVRTRMETFMKIHSREKFEKSDLAGDVTTMLGRESITKRTQAVIEGKDGKQKLGLLRDIIASDISCLEQVDILLAARQIIASIEDNKSRKAGDQDFTISAAYTIMAEHLPKVTEIRQFCLISETLDMMLKTKWHSLSQYNIDCTIGSITIFCSSQAPSLQPVHSGTIYTHLCRLLQSILMHHRLKLQGHTHLTQQAMQALLRCLFIPSNPLGPSSTPHSKAKFASPPSWLQALTVSHAQHFTKLLLLIADPPLSTLSQGRTNPLVSLKDKAKRMSAQWTKFILQEYIWLQLDMNVRMERGVREALMQGWFAVLETMNETGRDAMRGEMDSGGRAVFRGLFEEWRRVGGRREG